MRRLSVWLRLLGYILAMAVSIAAGLGALKVWNLWPWAAVLVVVLAAGATFVGSLFGLWHQQAHRKEQNRKSSVREIAFSTFMLITDKPGLNIKQMGYGVYQIRRRWLLQFRKPRDDGQWSSVWPIYWRQMIEPIDRFRPMASPSAIHDRWYKGMGVIGLCMEKRDGAHADAPGIYSMHPQGMTKEQWLATVSDEDRMGMTFAEWELARGAALPVRAFPICDERKGKKKCRACFAIEGPPGEFASIMTDDVKYLMIHACSSVRNIIYPSS